LIRDLILKNIFFFIIIFFPIIFFFTNTNKHKPTNKQTQTQNTFKKIIGTILIKEGEPQTRAFILDKGKIARKKANQSNSQQQSIELDFAESGDTLGLLHLFGSDGCFATLECVEDSSVREISQSAFKDFLMKEPEFSFELMSLLGKKIRQQSKILSALRTNEGNSEGKIKVAVFDSSSWLEKAFNDGNQKGEFVFKFIKERLNVDTAFKAVDHDIICVFGNF